MSITQKLWLKMVIHLRSRPCFYYRIAHPGLKHFKWQTYFKAVQFQRRFSKIHAHGWYPFRNSSVQRCVAFNRKKIYWCDNLHWEDEDYWSSLDQWCLRYAVESVVHAARVQQWYRSVWRGGYWCGFDSWQSRYWWSVLLLAFEETLISWAAGRKINATCVRVDFMQVFLLAKLAHIKKFGTAMWICNVWHSL